MVQADRMTAAAPPAADARTRPHLLLLCGPTAVGKTACAISLAQQWRTEILSVDSIQIYRGLDVGSAKPSVGEREAARHHLIDIAEPDASYSAAQYLADFEQCLSEHFPAARIPIACGGTGLYFNAILYEYDFANAFDGGVVRAGLKERAEREGREALFAELQRADPESAAKLSPNDEKRVIRALEILALTGRRKSEFAPKRTEKYDFTVIGLRKEREVLYKQINERVLCMFKNGLIEEVEGLLRRGIDESCQSMQAIGYKETLRYLRGRQTLEETIAEIQQASRNYAKRQLTWFRRMPGIEWVDAGAPDAVRQIRRAYERRQEEILTAFDRKTGFEPSKKENFGGARG